MFELQIRTEGDVFQGDPHIVIAELLRQVATRMYDGDRVGLIRDPFDNTVGRFEYSPEVVE